ncbi:MAG: hypothetical protein M1814_003992 [Vezdaea aestivalis]|nr:MAG: hypothetical protein M1814_003992 [Vezdaea aestivalis]
MSLSNPSATGAQLIAHTLQTLKVRVLFGVVGIPVVDIAEECLKRGIRFLGFRNEQAASYAATGYGYLTGRPGICLVVGGPGVLHAMAGIGNASANIFPLLLLAGSSESHLVSKGAFQELDAVALLTPHVKAALRPASVEAVPETVREAYRLAWYGRPGPTFVDFPADCIQANVSEVPNVAETRWPPRGGATTAQLEKIVQLFKQAKAPLVVIGKGAAYARAETNIRRLIDSTSLPFLPTPMGKGVLPDSHPQNAASARSTALKHADAVLLLGARLNWILHFGEPPKWNPKATFIQVDISPEEIGRNKGSSELSIIGDLDVVASQLAEALGGWRWNSAGLQYASALEASKKKNEESARKKAADSKMPLTYSYTFEVIKQTLNSLSPPDQGGIVYVSEGANTMDISRSVFPVEHPRLRLDAGTHATMGVGLGYAIAAHAAYNASEPEGSVGPPGNKKIVALEGDSAFGFSAMEVETMARYGMDILVFVINNGGVYHGDSATGNEWLKLQQRSKEGKFGLRSTSLGWEVGYEKIAEACGGLGFVARDGEELRKATIEGFRAKVPVVVNVIIEAGAANKLEFGWQASSQKKDSKL